MSMISITGNEEMALTYIGRCCDEKTLARPRGTYPTGMVTTKSIYYHTALDYTTITQLAIDHPRLSLHVQLLALKELRGR